MKKRITWAIAALLLSTLLAACGGGGSGAAPEAAAPVVAPAPQPQPPVPPPPPPPPADATLSQLANSVTVTPGETFRLVIASTSCVVDPRWGICAKQVPIGEIGVKTSLKLSNVKFTLDGIAMEGVSPPMPGEYVLFPTGFYTVWKPGQSIEITATLDPTIPSGTAATVVLEGTSSSFNESLDVVPLSDQRVTVFAQANYAPARIDLLGVTGVPVGFAESCPTTVSQGCVLQFTTDLLASPNTEVDLYQDDVLLFQAWTDWNGHLRMMTGSALVYGGQTSKFTVKTAGQLKSIQFSDFLSIEGNKQIAPLKPDGCTIVTPESSSCKG